MKHIKGVSCPHYFQWKSTNPHKDIVLSLMHGYQRVRMKCPHCGSLDIAIGCPFQDCEECTDMEMSNCNVCHSGWGGMAYWENL